jgi:cell division protein FtsZ
MTLHLSMPKNTYEIKPRITVVGVGGAGGNAVNNMIRSNLEGVEFIVSNTDAQALAQSICDRRLQLGINITQGLGAGSRPDIGRAAAEEVLDHLIAELEGSNMVFITAGMGGGTGTGAAPVIARAAREHGILTVGVVTKPFHFEGTHRMRLAESGIQELQQYVDTLIIIPNQNLFRVANEKTTFADAFAMADQVLYSGVRGVTDLMVMPGLINLDFADIRAVMTEMGKAMMGTGEAEGENRAVAAAEAAISNPLLDDVSMKGARGVLINITGGFDMTLFEVDEAANRIRDEVDPEANIIFGSTFDKTLEGKVRISVVATGIEAEALSQPRPALTLVAKGGRVMSAPAAEMPVSQPMMMSRVREERMPEVAIQAAHQPMYQPAQAQPMPQPASQVPAYAAMPTPQHQEQPMPMPMAVGAGAGNYAARPMASPAMAPATPQPAPMMRHEPIQQPRPNPAEVRERPAPRMETRPTAQNAELPFVAPPAFEPARGEVPVAAPVASEPVRQSSGEKRRGANIFTRVTNSAAAWARQTSADLREATPAAVMNRMAAAEPPARAPQPTAPQQAAPQPTPQPRLSLDPADRLAPRQSDEDLLDIPAFLRRQAN